MRGREFHLQRFQIVLDKLKGAANPRCPSAASGAVADGRHSYGLLGESISSQEILKVCSFL
jgi:hypothetical protein